MSPAVRDLCVIHHGGGFPLVTSRQDERGCRVDRCALFVDAGYVLGDGALAVHGTRNRESVSWDYAGVLGVLKSVARDHTGLPLLRCYWYEVPVEGGRGSEHDFLADLPGVTLRLGKVKHGRREGVEGEIRRDLTTLARNRAISDALVVTAEEDLAQAISDVQDLGLRVTLVHIAAPGRTPAAALRRECDEIVEISEAHLRPSVELVVGAEPVAEEGRAAAAAYASRAGANGHGAPGVVGQPAAAHAAAAAIYTGPVIAEYQRAAQPEYSDRPASADVSGPAVAANEFAADQGGPYGPRDITGQPTLPPAPPGHHVAVPGHHAALGQHVAIPGHHGAPAPQHAAPGSPLQSGQPAPYVSGPLLPSQSERTEPLPPTRSGGQQAGPPAGSPPSGPAAQGQPAHPGLPPQHPSGPLVPGPAAAGRPVPGQPGAPAQGFPAPTGLPGPHAPQAHAPQPRQGVPAYQAAPPPPPAPAPAPAPPRPAALPPSAVPPGYRANAPDIAGGQAPAVPRPPTAGAPPGPAPVGRDPGGQAPRGQIPGGQIPGGPAPGGQIPGGPAPGGQIPGGPPPGAAPAGGGPAPSAVRLGQQPQGGLVGYPAPPPGPADERTRQFPVQPGGPGGAPYVLQQGPHSGPQPVAQPPLVPQPVAVSLADAVQAAHGEGFNFGQGVARDAPALWLEAVLARKPRMPSDLEARLLQDSSLPIDSLLHDEVRHALRRGFWDALERARH